MNYRNEKTVYFNVDLEIDKSFRKLCIGLDIQKKTLFTAMIKYVEENQEKFEKWLEKRRGE